jgi:RNA polymerase sigma factor (TIGR02999 family)
MRSVVVDLARERLAARRGGGAEMVTLDTNAIERHQTPALAQPLDVDAALAALEAVDPRLAKVVEMRYFAGYTEVEIAEILGLTERTVRRDWQKAKLLLRSMIAP